MKCISSFVDQAPPAPPETLAVEACARLSQAGARGLAVGSSDRIQGLVTLEALEKAIAIGLGQSPVRAFMTGAPVAIDVAARPHEIANALLQAHADADGGFVVTKNGDYVGVGDLRTLLEQSLAEAATEHDIGHAVQAVSDAEAVAKAAHEQFRGFVVALRGEFETQIEGVTAMADLLLRQPLGRDALAQAASIRASGDALLRLANDALDMAEAQGGRLTLTAQSTQLRALIDGVQESWTRVAAESGVSLLISYDGDPDLWVSVDAARLRQIYDNLVDNALRYTRQGSVEVSLRARRDRDEVVLQGRVRDSSPGLAGAKLARIFDPAPEGPAEGRFSLPMTLTREILQSMHGSIRAESNVGQGVTIVFDLIAPLVQAESGPGESDEAARGFRSTHVLVVDDNATNRMVAEALCEMFDCTSESVEDGAEAVEAAATGRFDLILMDIKMPRMDGIAATKAIRDLPNAARSVPIVALTANVDPEDARNYLEAGMICVVEKPIKPERLLHAINLATAPSADCEQIAAA